MSMGLLVFLAIGGAGKAEELVNQKRNKEAGGSGYLLMAAEGVGGAETMISNLPKGEMTEYRVREGDTVSSIAVKFGITIDTIVWENGLRSAEAIKAKQILRILPVTGIRHIVRRGETVYSIAKRYQVDAQNIVDYPFNSFTDDEVFALATGQELVIPEGIKPNEVIVDTQRHLARTVAPIPGVVGEGNFIWPTSGQISQRFSWYHRAVDIANPKTPEVLAAQGGTVISAGWGGGYGNYIIIDHGNGYQTVYGHLKNGSLAVKAGDRVRQGQKIGIMGSTGRSTGPHLHFEIRTGGGNRDPLTILK